MIIPIKCVTCGNVLADKYLTYKCMVIKENTLKNKERNYVEYLTKENVEKTIEGKILDDLKIERICCRSHFICYNDFSRNISV